MVSHEEETQLCQGPSGSGRCPYGLKAKIRKSWREGPTPAAIEGAINRHGPGCAPASEPARIACALRNLSRGARIIVYTVRYDEGHVAEDRVDLEKGLARLK